MKAPTPPAQMPTEASSPSSSASTSERRWRDAVTSAIAPAEQTVNTASTTRESIAPASAGRRRRVSTRAGSRTPCLGSENRGGPGAAAGSRRGPSRPMLPSSLATAEAAAKQRSPVVERASTGQHAPTSAAFEEQIERARAHERANEFEAALEAYGSLARLDPSRREPLQGLRRLYAERGSWDAVLQVAELEIGLLAQPEERARLLTQMARIWERELGDTEQAQQLLARARHERSRSTRAAADASPRDESSAAPTLVQRAWLASARGDAQGAVAALHDALAQDASDVEALDMLLTVLEGAERYGEMSDLLERRASLATEDATRSVVLARLGALREAQQGDLAGARLAYERALEADAGNRAARSALQRIYRRGGAWPALRALLESATRTGAPADRAAASAALGALLEQQFDDPHAAAGGLHACGAAGAGRPRGAGGPAPAAQRRVGRGEHSESCRRRSEARVAPRARDRSARAHAGGPVRRARRRGRRGRSRRGEARASGRPQRARRGAARAASARGARPGARAPGRARGPAGRRAGAGRGAAPRAPRRGARAARRPSAGAGARVGARAAAAPSRCSTCSTTCWPRRPTSACARACSRIAATRSATRSAGRTRPRTPGARRSRRTRATPARARGSTPRLTRRRRGAISENAVGARRASA